MDTRMLDVAIGLALVFAITSLLATAIQEGWAAMRKTRSNNLKLAIRTMADDDDRFVEALYAEPLVKSLFLQARGGPSYLPSDVFSTALFSLLSKSAALPPRQGTPVEFIRSISFQAGAPAGLGSLLQTLESLAAGVERDWPAFEKRVQAWYEHAGDRSIGWFKRDTQLSLFVIGAGIAIGLNIDAIIIGNALWTDPELRTRTTELAIRISADREKLQSSTPSPTLVPEKASAPLPNEADVTKFAQAETDAAVKAIKDAFVVVATGSSGTTLKALLKGPLENVWNIMAVLIPESRRLRALPQQDAAALAKIEKQIDDDLKRLGDVFSPSTLPALSQAEKDILRDFQKKTDQVTASVIRERAAAVAVVAKPPSDTRQPGDQCTGFSDETLMGYCRDVCEKLSDPNNRGACRDTLLLKSLSSAGIPIGWDEAKLKALASFSLPFKLVGWLITAVAVTLGSPFWFDALGKLVKMRSAGAKVEGAPAGEASTPKSVTTPTSTPSAPIGEASDDALNDDERRLTEDEIIAIQRGLLMTNDKLTGRLDGNTRAAITSWQGKRGYTVTQELSRAQIDELRHNNSGAAGIQPLASQIAEG